MSDLPSKTGGLPTSGSVDVPVAENIPAWLAARRSRSAPAPTAVPEPDVEIEFASIPDSEVAEVETQDAHGAAVAQTMSPVLRGEELKPDVARSEVEFSRPALPPPPRVERPVVQPPPLKAKTIPPPVIRVDDKEPEEDPSWNARIRRWIHSASMAGVLTSVLFHTVMMSVLAVLVIHGATRQQSVEISSVLDDSEGDEFGVEIDTKMEDPGSEAAPEEFADLSALLSSENSFDPSDAVRGVPGGNGNGTGSGGEGDGQMALPAVNIPKYAVTKGSFSAWTEPRDPEPGISYEIVIQYKLPRNVKVYRSSDLTGMVIGTDGYKQAIKFSRNQTLDVKDGEVQVRIRVPGAQKLVRDTIRIASKVLREQQVIEIEF
jgi:hypothetical protein